MKPKLKKLKDQVVVITGASSGIGLTTARMAAQQGARLVLAARNEDALEQLVDEIHAHGGEAVHVECDVGREDDLRRVAQAAIERFGGFDTWVNNAGVSIYGRILEVPPEDMHRVIDTNFWGAVYGSRIAADFLREHGGALINIGSTLSDRAIPLQGIYCASKHALKGFTDSLRMELEEEGAPVSVTLIKPAAIDTPYTEHAKNYLDSAPKNPPPVYAPEVVADAILYCAEHPERDVFAGAGGKMMSASGHYAPRLTDKVMEKFMFSAQHSDKPPRDRDDNALFKPGRGLRQRGDYEGHVAETSVYTKASLHPLLTGIAAAGLALAVGAMWSREE